MTGIPMWFSNAKCEEVVVSGVTFYNVEYLGIRFRVNGDKSKFRAEDIIKTFNSRIDPKTGKVKCTNHWTAFSTVKKGKQIMEVFGDDVDEVEKCGSYNGHYMSWFLFNSILHYSADPINVVRFEQGKPIDLEAPNKGYLYVIQPIAGPKGSGMTTCVDTDIFKYGRTWNMKQRMAQYGSGTKVYAVVEVDDIERCESILKDVAKQNSIGQEAAYKKEYFRMENYDEAVLAFIDAVYVMGKMGYKCGEIDIRVDFEEKDEE